MTKKNVIVQDPVGHGVYARKSNVRLCRRGTGHGSINVSMGLEVPREWYIFEEYVNFQNIYNSAQC